jgi:hypothetical protein
MGHRFPAYQEFRGNLSPPSDPATVAIYSGMKLISGVLIELPLAAALLVK